MPGEKRVVVQLQHKKACALALEEGKGEGLCVLGGWREGSSLCRIEFRLLTWD